MKPWKLLVDGPKNRRELWVVDSDGELVHVASEDSGGDWLRYEAHARLIAAAPELLDALKELAEASDQALMGSHAGVPLPGQIRRFTRACNDARKAIAKAEG